MKIRKVSIIGLGALGILFGQYLTHRLPLGDLKVIADENRISRYKRDGIYSNGEKVDFHFMEDNQQSQPVDLLVFSVKFSGLKDAIASAANQVGENTLIISTLNGIASEKILAHAFGQDKIIPCVAQGMDAVKIGNKLTYKNMGMLVFGDFESEKDTEKVTRVKQFFQSIDFPYLVDNHMNKRLWSKFMLNVGVNQTVAVYRGNYGIIQKDGEAKTMMIEAMREVLILANKENVLLTEEDIKYWIGVLAKLSPLGMPSTRQDIEARRYSEVDIFSGTVLELAKKHGVNTPVNQYLNNRIKEIESTY